MLNTSTDHPGQGALRAKGCAAYFGIGISTWWKWVKDGRVPPGIKLSPRTTVWSLEIVQGLLKGTPDQL